jgi:hypothetical protein
MANALTKKLGPLQAWQWLAIGGGGGLMLYLYERNKSSTGSETPEGELAGSTNNPFGEGGGSTGAGETTAATAPAAGPIGEPGPGGAPGTPAQELSAGQLETLNKVEEGLNSPPVGTQAVAPVTPATQFGSRDFTRKTLTGKTGAEFQTKTIKGKLAHVYDAAVQGGQTVKGVGGKDNVVFLARSTGAGKTTKADRSKKPPLKAPKPKPTPKPEKPKPKPAPKKTVKKRKK